VNGCSAVYGVKANNSVLRVPSSRLQTSIAAVGSFQCSRGGQVWLCRSAQYDVVVLQEGAAAQNTTPEGRRRRCDSETLALGNLKYCGKFAAQCEFEG
jgi:hypothetical protein